MLSEAATGASPAGDFALGDWLVRPSLNRVSRGDATVHLEPRAMDVLAFLALRAGHVVAKREIIDTVWRKHFISETTLTHTIAVLRGVLGDDAHEPRYIETIPKRGYRLVAPVRAVTGGIAGLSRGACACWLELGDREVHLANGETLIGRDAGCRVRIDAMGVSRRHARITVAFGRATLEDLGSKNGTYICGEEAVGPRELADNDQIGIGPTVLIFRVGGLTGSTETDAPL